MDLTTTQRQIIVGLLSTSSPVSLGDLAHALNLSASTVSYQLPAVELWLHSHSFALDRQPGGGIWVDTDNRNRHALIDTLAETGCSPGALGSEERRDLLTFMIHTSPGPLILQQFQNRLEVSRSTILKDLAAIAEWYESRDLFLVKRPNYGTKLMGKELDWRKVLLELVFAHFDEATLFRFCADGRLQTCPLRLFNPPLAELMAGYLGALPLTRAREFVGYAEAQLTTRFIDTDHLTLALYITLLVRRTGEHHVIEMDAAQLKTLIDQPAYRVACDIAKMIQESFGLVVPQGEVGHLTLQILNAKPDNRLLGEMSAEAGMLAHSLLARAGGILKRTFDRDSELLGRLAAHLGSTLQRLRLDLPIRNPLLDEIRTRYSETYEACRIASDAITDYVGKPLPPDEIAYIAMYLAGAMMRYDELRLPNVLIVCPSGAATSWLLHSRLKKEIPNLPIVDIMSTRDLQRGIPRDVDLIVSTVPLRDAERPVVVVSALLSAADVAALRQAVDRAAP